MIFCVFPKHVNYLFKYTTHFVLGTRIIDSVFGSLEAEESRGFEGKERGGEWLSIPLVWIVLNIK